MVVALIVAIVVGGLGWFGYMLARVMASVSYWSEIGIIRYLRVVVLAQR